MPFLFLYGPTGTGKSECVQACFAKKYQSPYLILSLSVILSEKQFYEKILSFFVDSNILPKSVLTCLSTCDTLADFLTLLASQEKFALKNAFSSPIYIILERVDRLLKNFPHLIPPLVRFREFLPWLNLSWIWLSRLSWDKYIAQAHGIFPISIYFPPYTQTELMAILKNDFQCPLKSAKLPDATISSYTDFFDGFISLILKIFYPFCQNVLELRKISATLLPKYAQPVQSGSIPLNDVQGLYKAIQPFLKLGQYQFFQFLSLNRAPEKSLITEQGYTSATLL